MIHKLKKVFGFYREVPTSFFDMTFDEQVEWVTELLQGMAPSVTGTTATDAATGTDTEEH